MLNKLRHSHPVAAGVLVVAGATVVAALVFVLFLRADDDAEGCDSVAGAPLTDRPVEQTRFDNAFAGLEEARRLTERARDAGPTPAHVISDPGVAPLFRASPHDPARHGYEALRGGL
ncbi:MAG: hypothetical protein WEB00_11105 [Dehalococcoidia bacterium]